MATEFDDSEHYGFFLTGPKLDSSTGRYVRMSALVLAALRAAGVFSTMEDGTTAPATDKLWLDKNTDPPTLKEWDATGASWVPMTYGRLFGRAAVDKLTVTGGTGNAVVVSQPAGFQADRLYLITPTADNATAATIQVAGVGTYQVKYGDGSDIDASEFSTGRQSVLFFTGARFEVVFPVGDLNSAVSTAVAAASSAAGSASSAATSATNAASAATSVIIGATADDTVDDADEVIYKTSSTIKRGTLTGLISSIFKTARTIANAQFAAASFKLFNAAGTPRSVSFNATALTADRIITLPDKSLSNLDRPVLHIRDQKAAGVDGGASVVGVQVRTLNTVLTNGIAGASLSSNQITLPAGDYEIDAWVPSYRSNGQQASLRTSAGTYLVDGTHAVSDSSNGSEVVSHVAGRFTLASSTALEIIHYCQTARATNGLGGANSSGRTTVFTDVIIRRVD